MSAHLTRGRWPLLASLATAALITACGGGGDAPLPDSTYISWRNSANDVVIKDWNNESFAVRRDTGQVARYADDRVPRRRAEGAIQPRGHAAREMRVGPSKPAYRRRLQTTHCCCAKEAWW